MSFRARGKTARAPGGGRNIASGGGRNIALAALLAAGLPAGAAAIPADAGIGGAPLRLCADPSNLPFSAQSSDSPGIYNELGQTIAGALGRPLDVVWSQSYFGKHVIKDTLLAGKCDAYIGLPDSGKFMGPKLIFSRPFLNIGYAIVSARARPYASLADLKGRRVAVQLSTPPEILLGDHPEIEAASVLDPEAAMRGLAAGKADAAIIWGPSAGYLNKTVYGEAYVVQPVSGPGMQWPVAVGFARAHGALRDDFDRILAASGDRIATLAAKYGFPRGEPISLADAAAAKITLAAADQAGGDQQKPAAAGAAPAPAPAESPAPAAAPAAAAADPATIAAGREIFNGTCSHCHGPDAVIGQRKIDLRLLNKRYGDQMDEVFHTTVTNGRPDKGMPNWSGVFSEEEFSKILAYLHSVQH